MKSKLLLVSTLLITLFSFAQVPQGISYQAIALNSSGNPVVSANVGVRLSVLDNSSGGTVLYSETQTKTTNDKGLFNLTIGQGTPTSGTFAAINWKVNSKFLKVEMDTAGGTNYVLTGTTQLLSVPYALAADGLVMSAGEALTLVSPNGTSYQLSVNDSGQLSLPTSGATGSIPNSFYLYGSFNSFDPFGAQLMQPISGAGCGLSTFAFYKYFTSGTQLKLLAENNASSPVYGINGTSRVVLNGSAVTIPSDGFYALNVYSLTTPTDVSSYTFVRNSISVTAAMSTSGTLLGTVGPTTYNVATNKFSFNLTGVTAGNTFVFEFQNCAGTANRFGDNLNDGTIDYNGTSIFLPGLTSTPKNFRVELTLNTNGSGNYTITQL